MAIAGANGVDVREGQSEHSRRNDVPFGRVVTAIEVFDEEGQNTLNANSRVEVAPSMELFNRRTNHKLEYRAELPLNTIASMTVHQPDQSARTRWKNTARQHKEIAEIEFFDQEGRQDTLNVQSRVRPPSMKFSPRNGSHKVICEVELTRMTSADRRGLFGRRDQSLRPSRKVALFSNEVNEIEYLEQSSQGISNWKSKFRVPSLNFSDRTKRNTSAGKVRCRNGSRSRLFKLKITPL